MSCSLKGVYSSVFGRGVSMKEDLVILSMPRCNEINESVIFSRGAVICVIRWHPGKAMQELVCTMAEDLWVY